MFCLVADHNQSYISHVIKDTSVLPAARKMLQNNIHFRHQGVIVQVNFMTEIHRKQAGLKKKKKHYIRNRQVFILCDKTMYLE